MTESENQPISITPLDYPQEDTLLMELLTEMVTLNPSEFIWGDNNPTKAEHVFKEVVPNFILRLNTMRHRLAHNHDEAKEKYNYALNAQEDTTALMYELRLIWEKQNVCNVLFTAELTKKFPIDGDETSGYLFCSGNKVGTISQQHGMIG